MPTYNVSLSLTRPPSLGDAELVELLRHTVKKHTVKKAMCEAVEVAPAGLVVECEAAALERLETELRSNLEARGGSLGRDDSSIDLILLSYWPPQAPPLSTG
jgi:hypothetical protein